MPYAGCLRLPPGLVGAHCQVDDAQLAHWFGLPAGHVRLWLALLVGLHDFGKGAAPGFQVKWPLARRLMGRWVCRLLYPMQRAPASCDLATATRLCLKALAGACGRLTIHGRLPWVRKPSARTMDSILCQVTTRLANPRGPYLLDTCANWHLNMQASAWTPWLLAGQFDQCLRLDCPIANGFAPAWPALPCWAIGRMPLAGGWRHWPRPERLGWPIAAVAGWRNAAGCHALIARILPDRCTGARPPLQRVADLLLAQGQGQPCWWWKRPWAKAKPNEQARTALERVGDITGLYVALPASYWQCHVLNTLTFCAPLLIAVRWIFNWRMAGLC